MKQGFIIPVYNHGKTAVPIVEQLSPLGLPILLIDDGSDMETKAYLTRAAESCPRAVLVTLEKNRGKGAAVRAGIAKAHEMNLTHVLQIDADGQHDINRAAFFLEQSAAHPDAAICSRPEYDESAPANRRNGRVVANTWAKIVTLSPDIIDALLGFRVYPVEPVWRILRRHYTDLRMGFDPEILVRMHWKNIPLLFFPIRVIYPRDGISHFNLIWDNVRISIVFTRLCIGMLLRLPLLVGRRIRRGSWSIGYE
jgi:glycosyltransferase involved in cell wall biosynthesis